MIHGVLHLLGYHDKDLLSQTAMRKKEDDCLGLRRFLIPHDSERVETQ